MCRAIIGESDLSTATLALNSIEMQMDTVSVPTEPVTLFRYIDKASLTSTVPRQPETIDAVLKSFDFIADGTFSCFFNDKEQGVYQHFLACQAKLKKVDRELFAKVLQGKIDTLSADQITTALDYIFTEVADAMNEAYQAIEQLEPKPRLFFSIKLTTLMAGIVSVVIAALCSALPVACPSLFFKWFRKFIYS